MRSSLPVITIHPHTQKSRSDNKSQNGVYWPDFLSPTDLQQICLLATGLDKFTLKWLDENEIVSSGGKNYKYNVGNVVKILHNTKTTYITLGYPLNDGRNSYFQQVGPAYRRYLEDPSKNKNFMFYALPLRRPDNFGRVLTLYHHFMFRVLSAAGIKGNWLEFLKDNPPKFQNLQKLIASRNRLSKKNNNASYIYYDSEEDSFYLFLKTYGASKYESFFFALAAINIELEKKIHVRELEEGKLTGLPEWAQNHIEEVSEGRVRCHFIEMEMDDHRERVILFPPSLRTPRYRVNVSNRCGPEVCAFCDNDNPREIEAAHIWDVHKLKLLSIKNDENIVLWDHASNGHNGIWLCKDHHRAFDNNTILIDLEGYLLYNIEMSERVVRDLRNSITKNRLDLKLISNEFLFYLKKRHEFVDIGNYHRLFK